MAMQSTPQSSSEEQYVKQTRGRYQDEMVAAKYRSYHTRGLSWIRLTMWRQMRIVEQFLAEIPAIRRALVLDVPCGTGLLAEAFRRTGTRAFAGDVSLEMIRHARPDYEGKLTVGFARQDITKLPLRDRSVQGIVTLGLFHRLPKEVRLAAVDEMARVANYWLIISFTENSFFHLIKREILRKIYPGYLGAPSPWELSELLAEVRDSGFILVKKRATVPLLSSEVVCLFERGETT